MKDVFSVPATRSIFLAQLISVSGDRMFAIALAWWVVSQENLDNREFILGVLLSISTLPMVLSGPLFGPLIDKFSKRSCMMVADIVRLLLMTMLGLLIDQNALSIPLLFALCIPLFALEPLFDAAVSASLSSMSQNPSMLAQLVALESAIPNAGAVIGALFGSIALALWGTEWVFWFNTSTFLISLIFVSTLPVLNTPANCCNVDNFSGGYSFLKNHPEVIQLMVLFAVVNFFIAPLFLYLPLLARDVLQVGGSQLSLLELGFAVGNLALFVYFVAKPKEFFRARWLRFFLVASSAGFLFMLGSTKSLLPMFATLVAWGASFAFVTYLANSSFQRTIPDAFKGRFFAILTSLCTLSVPLSFVCFGFLSSHFSLQELIFSNAACVLFVSFSFLTVPDEHSKTTPD